MYPKLTGGAKPRRHECTINMGTICPLSNPLIQELPISIISIESTARHPSGHLYWYPKPFANMVAVLTEHGSQLLVDENVVASNSMHTRMIVYRRLPLNRELMLLPRTRAPWISAYFEILGPWCFSLSNFFSY